ncbi:MAG: hypothetical protein QOH35_2105 [Acidobacteriaceae bacterium]|jgi:hypothetical protein|nr:hypothetical protein [Acidobacteriaceae bacterium]
MPWRSCHSGCGAGKRLALEYSVLAGAYRDSIPIAAISEGIGMLSLYLPALGAELEIAFLHDGE